MKDRNKKLIIMIALIAVVGVSIGFAAFSSSLLIKSSLSVDPDSSTFSVVFSSSSTALETNAITPTVNPTTLTASSATINNSGKYPTIENLEATFTEPGDSVSYTFYARNTGKYDAYLTSIVFQNLTSGVFKTCKATDGTNSELVTSACSSISATVTVGSESATTTKQITTEHKLAQNSSETVTVTLSYAANGARADEPFEVTFGNIYLTYGTQTGMEIPSFSTVEPGSTFCVAKNSNKAGSTTLGTEYQCDVDPNSTDDNGYTFYVLSTSGNYVNLLMSENLEDNQVFTTNIYEIAETDESYNNGKVLGLNGEVPTILSELATLTSSWTNIPDYSESYTDYGIGYTLESVSNYTTTLKQVRLPKYEELAGEGKVCPKLKEKSFYTYVINHYYADCKAWAIGDYWTLSIGENHESYIGAYAMNSKYETVDIYRIYDYEIGITGKTFGIRPVITVSASDLS